MLIRLGIPQLALAFIFIGRGSRTPFRVGLYKDYKNKTKPTRTRSGQTGLTDRPDRSDRSASGPANFARQHMPSCFLVSFTSQKARTDLIYVFYTEHTNLKNKTKGDIQYRPSSSSCTWPYARIEPLQVPPIDSPW